MVDILDELECYPPRCVELLQWEGVDSSRVEAIQPEEGFTHFRVACPCGTSDLSLLGYAPPYAKQAASTRFPALLLRNALRVIRESFAWRTEPGEVGLVGPLTLRCDSCGRDSILFDPRVDGARAELGHETAGSPSAGCEAFRCRLCHSTQTYVLVGVGHGQTSWRHARVSRPQDLFDLFQVFTRCSRCENLVLVSQTSTEVGVDVWRSGRRRELLHKRDSDLHRL